MSQLKTVEQLRAVLPEPRETTKAKILPFLDEQANARTTELEAALDSLSDAHRQIILLRKFEELSFREISDRLGKSEDACRMLLARAMTALTLKLAGPGGA